MTYKPSAHPKEIIAEDLRLIRGLDGELYLQFDDGANIAEEKSGLKMVSYGGFNNALVIPSPSTSE